MRDCEPFSECWCIEHPNACDNVNDNVLPINNGLLFLVVFALIYGINKLYKHETSN